MTPRKKITITIKHMEKLVITITMTFTKMAEYQLQYQLQLGSLTDKNRYQKMTS